MEFHSGEPVQLSVIQNLDGLLKPPNHRLGIIQTHVLPLLAVAMTQQTVHIRCTDSNVMKTGAREEKAHQAYQQPLMLCQTWHAATKRAHSTLPQSKTGRGPAYSESGTVVSVQTCVTTNKLSQTAFI